jgi:hypothetical protein
MFGGQLPSSIGFSRQTWMFITLKLAFLMKTGQLLHRYIVREGSRYAARRGSVSLQLEPNPGTPE